MRLASVQPRRGTVHTPLRYPGGKTRLTGFIREVLRRGDWTDRTYAEPYAGGAGAAVSLLVEGRVPRIAVNDLDPAIYSFWRTVVEDNEWLVAKILDVTLNLEEWAEQRATYQSKDRRVGRDLGFATFYLNRTNRSGVLNAGVIGGKSQAGRYKLDARFNREDLAERVRVLGDLREQIEVSMEDGAHFLARHLDSNQAFVYADPPYYDKGSFLYLNSFDDSQHASLAAVLNQRTEAPWILTYDNVPEVRELYRGRYQGLFELPYSAHRSTNFVERMIVSSSVARTMPEFG